MITTSRTVKASIVAAVTLAAALPAAASAAPNRATQSASDLDAAPAGPLSKASAAAPGSRSLGDPLFPQIGNGGYDVTHYTIELDYDPAENVFNNGTSTTIDARAKQDLSEFSLDFQDLDVSSVTVNGRTARFAHRNATPKLSKKQEVTQPMKLIVTPDKSAIPRTGEDFEVEISYSGQPVEITDPDTSIEGWIRACYPLAGPKTCDGSFVVNEPIGAQSWFPSNNYPTDKARFDTLITVPQGKTALGVGELVSNTDHGDGTATWHWSEDDPTATYLTTATVGDFDDDFGDMTETSTGRLLDVYNSIDSSATQVQRDAINASLARAPGQLNFLSELLGPYPFDSIGAVADRAAGVGYALEVQTKPHYAGGFSTGNPSINIVTQLHEIAHMWVGNSVSPATWHEIWFNEGWATWLEWVWEFEANGSSDSPADRFDELYNGPDVKWDIAPAVLDNDPANLFNGSAVYDRPAMMIEGYRQIVGDGRFYPFLRELVAEFGYGNISREEFVDLALDRSGLSGSQLELLDEYFQQWLFLEERPTLTPDDF